MSLNQNAHRHCLLFIILFSLFTKCDSASSDLESDEMAYLDFKQVNTFTAPMVEGQAINRTFYYHVQDDSTITYLDRNNKTIWFWNVFQNEIVDSIDVNLFPEQRHYLTNYKILSQDSLILSYMPTYFGFQHDSVLMMVDTNQKVLANFNFRGAQVPMKHGNPDVKADMTRKTNWAFQIHNNTFPILYDAKKEATLTRLVDFGNYYTKKLKGTVGWAYEDTSKAFQSLPLTFRPDFEGYFPTEYRHTIGDYDKEGNLVVGKGYTSQLKKYNLKSGNLDSNDVNFVSIDTVHHFPTKDSADKHEKYLNYYKFIRHDPNAEWFWRSAQIGPDSNAHPLLINYPLHSIVAFDSNLNKRGEGILPPYHEGPVIPFNDGLLVKNQKATEEKGQLVFSHLKYEIDTIKKEQFEEKIQAKKARFSASDSLAINYLQDMTNSGGYERAVLLPFNNACPACKNDFFDFLEQVAKDSLKKKKPFAVLIMASDKSRVVEKLREYSLDSAIGDWIFIDDGNRHKKVMESWLNLKLVRYKADEITNEQVYGPGAIGELKSILTDYDGTEVREHGY